MPALRQESIGIVKDQPELSRLGPGYYYQALELDPQDFQLGRDAGAQFRAVPFQSRSWPRQVAWKN